MKKIATTLLIIVTTCLFMIFYIANVVETEIKNAFNAPHHPDFSLQLLTYKRNFWSASASSKLTVNVDAQTRLIFNIDSAISHLPYKATITNVISLDNAQLATSAKAYFGRDDWISSQESIDLFSQLTGKLVIAAGNHKSDSEYLSTKPVSIHYEMDLDSLRGNFQITWEGGEGHTNGIAILLRSLQFDSSVGERSPSSEYDYNLIVEKIEFEQKKNHSLLENILLRGVNQRNNEQKTIDTINELRIGSYRWNKDKHHTFTNNNLKLAVNGLYQPAFEILNTGSNDSGEVETALIELVFHGAQLTLSQLNSQTPWGEVDGDLDLTLEQGAALVDILTNPYILFDYISGDARLVLPVSLLQEPLLTEPLQIGVMAGFLEQNEQTLNLETSFHQGELIVNGRVIPL
ncbi:hypothetical protein CW745_09345 [Psychromonas sp. psych-6C06]|uniref:DUF945 family protein n=1 Tax=Psychromonas sp. psych-6C06 TaxID=2058089 RepID=UPI000C33D8B0|nr:DUF945 family protein [Psychromonas sp. psych-6C06]PKF61532.1 hypothetical protein CW745_09345 [Psychromonas sp. psych-6C06]